VQDRLVWREKALFVVVIIAQLLDTLTFMPAVARVGIEAERNVLVRHLYLSIGPAGPLLLKVASLGILIAALCLIRMRFPRQLLPVAIFIAGFGLFGPWSNITFGLLG